MFNEFLEYQDAVITRGMQEALRKYDIRVKYTKLPITAAWFLYRDGLYFGQIDRLEGDFLELRGNRGCLRDISRQIQSHFDRLTYRHRILSEMFAQRRQTESSNQSDGKIDSKEPDFDQ